jgi:lipid-binding SYLF domain-containing protein
VIVVSDAAGLYGGAAVKGGAVTPDTEANLNFYEDYLSVREILLSGKALKPSAATKKLHDALNRAIK